MSVSKVNPTVLDRWDQPEHEDEPSASTESVDRQAGNRPYGPLQKKSLRAASTNARHAANAAGGMPVAGTNAALINRHDGGPQWRNQAADQQNTEATMQLTKLSMTGLPPAQTDMALDEIQFAGDLAQMSDDKRADFTQRIMALRNAPDNEYAARLAALQAEVRAEVQRIQADPALRIKAVFNPPANVSILGADGQKQMDALRAQYAKMTAPGATAPEKEAAFANAVKIKTQMQAQILAKLQDALAVQQKLWSESRARVDKMLDDAEHEFNAGNIQLPSNSDDPEWDANTRKPAYAKTYPYQSVLEKLLSPDGYCQQDRGGPHNTPLSQEDRQRDLLTFQQGMSDPGSDVYKRMRALQEQATSTLQHPGPDLDAVSPPAVTATGIGAHPPAYDQNYLQNLRNQYATALQQTDLQNRTMLREHIPGTYDKVMYGIGTVLNSLSPIPFSDLLLKPLLDLEFPNQGGLTDDQVGTINLATMIGQMLLGGMTPEGEETTRSPVRPHGEGSPNGDGSAGVEGGTRGDGSDGYTTQYSGDLHSQVDQFLQHVGDIESPPISSEIPDSYALSRMPESYRSSKDPGVFIDNKTDQKFIIDHGRAYAVQEDRHTHTFWVYNSERNLPVKYPVRFDNHTSAWTFDEGVWLKGGGNREADYLKNQISRAEGVQGGAQAHINEAERDLARLDAQTPRPADYDYQRSNLQQRLQTARNTLDNSRSNSQGFRDQLRNLRSRLQQDMSAHQRELDQARNLERHLQHELDVINLQISLDPSPSYDVRSKQDKLRSDVQRMQDSIRLMERTLEVMSRDIDDIGYV